MRFVICEGFVTKIIKIFDKYPPKLHLVPAIWFNLHSYECAKFGDRLVKYILLYLRWNAIRGQEEYYD